MSPRRGHVKQLRFLAAGLILLGGSVGALLYLGSTHHGIRPTAGAESGPSFPHTPTATPTPTITIQTTAPDVVVTTTPVLTPPPDPVRGNTWSAIAQPCGSHEGTGMGDPNQDPTSWQTPFPGSCDYWYHPTSPQGGHPMDWGFDVAFEGNCAIEVHIPDVPVVTAPVAHYVVLDGPSYDIKSTAGFNVAQVIHRGEWFPVGTYHTTGELNVRLEDTGDSTTTDVIAEAVRVNCRRT